MLILDAIASGKFKKVSEKIFFHCFWIRSLGVLNDTQNIRKIVSNDIISFESIAGAELKKDPGRILNQNMDDD